MKPSDRRKMMKAQMEKRVQESYNSKDDSGKFKSYLIKDAMGKAQLWKCSEDEHFINIIPYIAGPMNPKVSEGNVAYNLDFFVHRKVGVNEDSYVCMAKTYGKPCPICETQAKIIKSESYDKDTVKALNPTRRVIYNIECLDSNSEKAKKIQLFDVSHFLFEKELAEIAKKPRGGGYILFSDPDDGKIVFFRKSGSTATNTEYKGFKFEDREEVISDDLLDAAVCLDSLLYIPSYEEVYKAFHGVDSDEASDNGSSDEGFHEDDEQGDATESTENDFVCPGNPPADYGTLDECEECPYVDECATEYEELEAKLAAEKEEAEKAKAETKPSSRLPRRGATEEKPEAKEQAPTPTVGRRLRR